MDSIKSHSTQNTFYSPTPSSSTKSTVTSSDKTQSIALTLIPKFNEEYYEKKRAKLERMFKKSPQLSQETKDRILEEIENERTLAAKSQQLTQETKDLKEYQRREKLEDLMRASMCTEKTKNLIRKEFNKGLQLEEKRKKRIETSLKVIEKQLDEVAPLKTKKKKKPLMTPKEVKRQNEKGKIVYSLSYLPAAVRRAHLKARNIARVHVA